MDIWDRLKEVITEQVKKSGIRKDSIQPGEIESDIFEEAVTNIYYDVAEFYSWFFNKDDDRTLFVINQVPVEIPASVKNAVKPVVDDNLDAMREVDEIPLGQDTPELDELITDNLSRYIINWQDWFYKRKREDQIDSYFEQASVHEDIYLDSDYGDVSNILDSDQLDRVSDIPYISDEL